ncbi:MAG: iron-dependent peroxidase [Fusobacteriota bacterium]
MNYTWEALIKNENIGRDSKDISFIFSDSFSPYIEVNLEEINNKDLPSEIEVNPYVRYYSIFKNLFNPNNIKNKEARGALFDLGIHVLSRLDRYQGMSKKEFFRKKIIFELENGEFGNEIQNYMKFMNAAEKNDIAENVYKFYKNGNGIYYFQKSVQDVFKSSSFYFNNEKRDEILIYVNNSEIRKNKNKFECIKKLFLPIGFEVEVYWKSHFGIIDQNTTMKVGKIKIY